MNHPYEELTNGQYAVVPQMPDAEYRQHPGLSQSQLKEFARSPGHYVASLAAERKESAALLFGTAYHNMLASHDGGKTAFIVRKKVDGRTKEGKDYNHKFEVDNAALIAAGVPVIDEDMANHVIAMVHKISEIPLVQELFEEPYQQELSMFTRQDDVLLKGRIDMLSGTTIVDWKTCEDASPQEVARSMRNFRYDLQDASYFALATACKVEVKRFIFAFQEKKPPYAVAFYSISDNDRFKAMAERKRLLASYRELMSVDEAHWPCFDVSKVGEITLWP